MSKWLKLPILLLTGPFVLLGFAIIVVPLVFVSFVYVVLSTAGFFDGGDPEKVPMFYAFIMVEAYINWLESL